MEQKIVNIAIRNLHQFTGINAFDQNKGPFDGVLEMVINGQKQTFTVEIKREFRTHQLQQIEQYFNDYENFLLVANHIVPKIKEELRQKHRTHLDFERPQN
ncbi:MAG: hypothetical protein JJU28_13865 [Cyclobacteriaceae bacterium]|nr:hypothetical protein [Cyclobacteriaceae bacterium]